MKKLLILIGLLSFVAFTSVHAQKKTTATKAKTEQTAKAKKQPSRLLGLLPRLRPICKAKNQS
jgi:hypothetical protein